MCFQLNWLLFPHEVIVAFLVKDFGHIGRSEKLLRSMISVSGSSIWFRLHFSCTGAGLYHWTNWTGFIGQDNLPVVRNCEDYI